MKLIDSYWMDKDGNTWNSKDYTRTEAIANSKTLIDCIDCIDCINCRDCYNCSHCEDVHGSHHCKYCHCCDNCHHCTACDNLWFCHHCFGCSCCYACCDYVEQPQIYRSIKINHNDNITFYYGKINNDKMSLQVYWNGFNGDLKSFEKEVLNENERLGFGEYKNLCLKEIAKAKALFELV